MEHYSTELTTLMCPLVALLGHPDKHSQIAEWLQVAIPPLQSISIASPQELALLHGSSSTNSTATSNFVLDAAWLEHKQRRCAAVQLIIVDSKEVAGDPSSWASLVAKLDASKSAAKAHNVRSIILVLRGPRDSPVPDDRISMVCRHAGVDKASIVPFVIGGDSQEADLLRLLPAIHTQAVAHYSGETQRRLADHSQANDPSVEANLRTAFKLGAVAEFRGDFEAAAAMYSEAYNYTQQLAIGSSNKFQRFLEVRGIAEYVHVKLMTLYLFGLRQAGDAASQLTRHLQLFNEVPYDAAPLALVANQWKWRAKQYTTAAELMVSSGTGWVDLSITNHPPRLLFAAAGALVERRKVSDKLIATISLDEIESDSLAAVQLKQGTYVAQYVDPSSDATNQQQLTESELLKQIEIIEVAADQGQEAISLLQKAVTAMQHSTGNAFGSICHGQLLLGQELIASQDTNAAITALQQAAMAYRAANWKGPLCRVLKLLRECAVENEDVQAQLALDLEIACILVGTPGDTASKELATTAVAQISQQSGPTMNFTVADGSSDWIANVLQIQAGWMRPQQGPGTDQIQFGVAICSCLPIELPVLGSLQVAVLDRKQNTHFINLSRSDTHGAVISDSTSIKLQPGRWETFVGNAPVNCSSGKAKAISLILGISQSCTISIALDTNSTKPKAAAIVPGMFVRHTSGFQPGTLEVNILSRHPPPVVTLGTYRVGLLGEHLPVKVVVEGGEVGWDSINLTLTASHRDTGRKFPVLSEDETPLSESLNIGGLPAGSKHELNIRIAPSMHGEVDIVASIDYSIANQDGANTEIGTVETTLAVVVQLPLELDLKMLVPPKIRFAYQNASSAGSPKFVQDTEAARSALDILSIADVSENGSPTPPEIDAAALTLMTAAWPKKVQMPAGVECVAVVSLAAVASSTIDILDVSWTMPNGSPVRFQRAQRTPSNNTSGICDRQQAVFTLKADNPITLGTLGNLIVTWKRRGDLDESCISATSKNPQIGSPRSLPASESANLGLNRGNATNRLHLRLPAAEFKETQLVTEIKVPSVAYIGGSIRLEMEVRSSESNKASTSQEIQLSVGQPNGFLVAGERSAVLSLLPGNNTVVSWELLPYHGGVLQLPEIKLVGSGDTVLHATQNYTIVVKHGAS